MLSPRVINSSCVINREQWDTAIKMSHRRNSLRKNCCSDVLTHFLRLRFTPEELEQRDKSRKIDKFLEKDKNSFRRQVMSTTFPIFHLPHHDESLFSVVSHFYYRRNWAHHNSRASIVYCLQFSCYILVTFLDTQHLMFCHSRFSRWNCFSLERASRESRRSWSKCESFMGLSLSLSWCENITMSFIKTLLKVSATTDRNRSMW